MNRAIIGLASTRTDGNILLQQAIEILTHTCISAKFSTCYLTAPVGTHSKNDYWNCIGIVESELGFETLKQHYKEMEKNAGRQPNSKQTGDVPLDIDIVVWNGEIIRPHDWEQGYFQKGLKQLNK